MDGSGGRDWYNGGQPQPQHLQQQQQHQRSPSNFIGIDMSASSSSNYPAAAAAGGLPQYGAASQQHGQTQVRKQPSTTHMYSASTTPNLSIQVDGSGSQQARRNSQQMIMSPVTGGSGMQVSPALRPGSASYNDSGRMSYSPAMPSSAGYQPQGTHGQMTGGARTSQQQQQQPNHGLGMQIAASHSSQQSQQQPYSPSAPFAGSSSGSSAYPDYHSQQHQYASPSVSQQQRSRPSQLLTTQSYSGPASSSGHGAQPSLKYNRTNSSNSALSVSTSPTTAGQASPLTPSSPVYQPHADTTFRVPAVHNQAQTATQQHQQQSQNSSHSRQQSTSQYTLPPPDGMQYASYLEDPMNGIDRRQGSYSPSHYAIAAANAAYYQQQQQQQQHGTGQSYGSSAASTSQLPLASPRHANTSNAFYTANPTPQSSNRQNALSPSYSRQQAYPGSPPTSSGGVQVQSRSSSVSSSQYQTASATSYSPVQTQSSRIQRPRSAASSSGSAFRRVRDTNDVKAGANKTSERRADPLGGTISPLKALTTQLSQTYHLVNPNFRYEFSSNPRRVLTKPSQPAGNNGYDNEDSDYILYVNDVLGEQGNKYLILDVLGQGTFGQVVKCQNMKTMEIVGVKVIKNKPAYYHQSMMEIIILEMLNSNYDPDDKHHILRLKDTFPHQNHLCLVFELLSSNLYELIKQNAFRGLSTSLVRVFTEQLLDALCVLKDAKLIHCDLKPENILLKTLQSPDIKIIDFGSACHELQTVYTYIQSRFYRSPEVLLGLPYSTSIDMWSLGCICVELFLGLPIFPGTSEYNQISRIVEMLGMPPEHMLRNGKQVSHFFHHMYDEYGNEHWRLKTMQEYEREHPNAKEQPSKKFFAATTLPEIIKTYPNQRKGLKQADLDREAANRASFIDFVTGLLNMDPVRRWTPQQAKLHPFVLNQPLKQPFVPAMGPSRLSSSTSGTGTPAPADRPYGGLQTAPRSSTKSYPDAASYQRHLNQQQAQSAAFTANAFRQAQSTNPYVQQPEMSPRQPMSSQHHHHQQQQQQYAQNTQQQQQQYSVPRLPPLSTSGRASGPVQHSPSQSMSYSSSSNSNPLRNSTSGPLSPNIPMNPPPAHHYQPARSRAGTFSQLDVPPALQKLGFDLGSFKTIGTPQLRRDDQRAAWERRNAGDVQLDRRRSLKQANPHLEHLEYYASGGYPAAGSSAYYHSPGTMQQPFSIVVDPRTAAEQQQAMGKSAPVQLPPPAYAGQGAGGSRYAAAPASSIASGSMPFDAFDSYDPRDGLGGLIHQPLIPTQQSSQQRQQQQGAYYGPPLQVGSSTAGAGYASLPGTLPYPGQIPPMNGASSSGGKQKRSDQQMWP